ncbi:DUF7696 family protein [Pseudomonas sp.]|uniref:DUF7696 family protein n=1 Tax=Pseudomonas sp. TaxID=306 RepID=UPI003FD7396A
MNGCSWKATPVTLIDGTVVDCDSEAWRFECEARYILNMPNKPIRIATLENIEKKRGLPSRQALEDKILEVWTARQAKAS